MHLGNYLELVLHSQQQMAKSFEQVADEHGDEPDVQQACLLLAGWSKELIALFDPFIKYYGEEKNNEPERLRQVIFQKPRKGSLALLRDLQDLYLIATEAHVSCVLLRQAADAVHDKGLQQLCTRVQETAKRQLSWLMTRMKNASPQALIAAE